MGLFDFQPGVHYDEEEDIGGSNLMKGRPQAYSTKPMSANPNSRLMPPTFDIKAFKQSIAIENMMRKENRGSSNVFSTNALLSKP